MPPRSSSPASSDGCESYWAEGYSPYITPSRSSSHRHERHSSHHPLSRGPDGYYYHPSADASMMRDSDFYSPDGRSKRYYHGHGRMSRAASIDHEFVPFEEMLEADERERRSRRGGDWLLLACATMVAAALYLFGDGEKKKVKRDMARMHHQKERDDAGAVSGKGGGRSRRRVRRQEETGAQARMERA